MFNLLYFGPLPDTKSKTARERTQRLLNYQTERERTQRPLIEKIDGGLLISREHEHAHAMHLAPGAISLRSTIDPLDATSEFGILHKNCRGLCTNDRMHELFLELRNPAVRRDVLTLHETWRSEKEEYFVRGRSPCICFWRYRWFTWSGNYCT